MMLGLRPDLLEHRLSEARAFLPLNPRPWKEAIAVSIHCSIGPIQVRSLRFTGPRVTQGRWSGTEVEECTV